MQNITTISQKGQIVVPKTIRDRLNIKPSDQLKITSDDKSIIVQPLSRPAEFLGMFKVKTPISKKEIKEAAAEHFDKKFK